MVSQVPIVSILLAVNGGLLVVMGLIYAGLGAMFGMIPKMENRPPRPEDETMALVMLGVFGVLGLAVVVIGVVQIVGGLRGFKFRGRTFALVALFAGLLALPTGYCAPTTIGVLIYGLIVLFDRDVKQAFAMAADGISKEEILARFARRRYQPPYDARNEARDDYSDFNRERRDRADNSEDGREGERKN